MKILIIIINNILSDNCIPSINYLKTYIENNLSAHTVDIACISSNNDFETYDKILNFKYKIINKKRQLDKICDFISNNNLDYDWFIKTRPEIEIVDTIDFNILKINSINARVRCYKGYESIKYGASVGGLGQHQNVSLCDVLIENLDNILFDDQIYIFDKNIVKNNGFKKIDENEKNEFVNLIKPDDIEIQNETFHTFIWKKRDINLNIIGLNVCFKRDGIYRYSGDINM